MLKTSTLEYIVQWTQKNKKAYQDQRIRKRSYLWIILGIFIPILNIACVHPPPPTIKIITGNRGINNFSGLRIKNRRSISWRILTPPMECRRHRYVEIGTLHAKGSISVGTVVNGYVIRPRKLPLKGRHYRVMDVQATRNTNWGTDEIIGMIKYVADKVAQKYPDSVLQVGNIGACGGGKIPWSVSHRSGRDMDLAFYLIDNHGQQVQLSNMVAVDRNKEAVLEDGRTVHFDSGRNWEMIKAILTYPEASVQWIFIANYLKRDLLLYAKEHNESPEIIWKAKNVMWQPYHSSAHADHIHVRIYCSKDDLLDGCRDIGSNRPWYTYQKELIHQRITELKNLIKKHRHIKDAIFTLSAIGQEDAYNFLLTLLKNKNTHLRQIVARALYRWGLPKQIHHDVVDIILKEKKPQVAFYLLYAWRNARVHYLTDIKRLLSSKRSWIYRVQGIKWAFSTRSFALNIIKTHRIVRCIPCLIDCLKNPDHNNCLQTLQYLTNRDLYPDNKGLYHAVRLWWYRIKKERLNKPLLLVLNGFVHKGILPAESVNNMNFSTSDYESLLNEVVLGKNWENAIYALGRLTHIWPWVPRYSLHSRRYHFIINFCKSHFLKPCSTIKEIILP